MRLATITNWAYGATVVLTLASATTMLLASAAQDRERATVEQRFRLDQATEAFDAEIFGLTDHARQYLNTGDPTYRILYQRNAATLAAVENRIRHIGDAGAAPEELAVLAQAIHWADTLHDEQAAAIAAYERGDERHARTILFGAEYERELDPPRRWSNASRIGSNGGPRRRSRRPLRSPACGRPCPKSCSRSRACFPFASSISSSSSACCGRWCG